MGGAMSKVALVAVGAVLGGAAVEAAHRSAYAAVEAVFDAIADAAEAAAFYVSPQYRAVASAAAESYEAGKRVVAQACDAVKRAAACVCSRVVGMIECLHGDAAAACAKRKLDGVNGFVQAGDVASLVAAILDGIKRASTPMLPNQSYGKLVSSKSKRASSATADIMGLFGLLSSAVGNMLGGKVPAEAKAAISVTAIAAQLVFAIFDYFSRMDGA